MLVGYCRVSTDDQSLDLQKDALEAAGCERIFEETASGAKEDRPILKEAIDFLRKDDVLTVWKLDRLGRSLPHLITLINQLKDSGIGFKSLQEQLDTTTTGGKFVFHVFAAIAEFEREIIRERTNAGLKAARARGRVGGRKRKLTAKQIEIGKALASDNNRTIGEICEHLGISRPTYYRHIAPKPGRG